jgi:hypothetical protein
MVCRVENASQNTEHSSFDNHEFDMQRRGVGMDKQLETSLLFRENSVEMRVLDSIAATSGVCSI